MTADNNGPSEVEVALLGQALEGVTKSLDEFKRRMASSLDNVWNELRAIRKGCPTCLARLTAVETRLQAAEARLTETKSDSSKLADKAWEVGKLLLGAAIGFLVAYLSRGG